VKKHVLVAPGVDKPEALVRESLDRAFCHLTNSSKSVLQRCPKTPCSGCSTANGSFYRVDWLQSTGSRPSPRPRERIWSPGGTKFQQVSLQCIGLRRLSSCSPVLTRAWPSGRVSEEWAGRPIAGPSDHGRHCGDRSSSVLDPRCTQLPESCPLKETSGEANPHDIGSRRAASARDSDAPSSVSKRVVFRNVRECV